MRSPWLRLYATNPEIAMQVNRREALQILAGTTLVPFVAAAPTPTIAATTTPVPVAPPVTKIFTTGLPTLDKAIGGGIHPGELVVVMGSAGSGKTSFVDNMARAINPQFNPKTDSDVLEDRTLGSTDLLYLYQNQKPFLRPDCFLPNIRMDNDGNVVPFYEAWANMLRMAKDVCVEKEDSMVITRNRRRTPVLDQFFVDDGGLDEPYQMRPVDVLINLYMPQELGLHYSAPHLAVLTKNRNGPKTQVSFRFSTHGCHEVKDGESQLPGI
jgi:energy-coupling factor transporter ATP-binding protein EcfA2